MSRHLLELVLHPGRDGMKLAVLVAYEFQISRWNGEGLGTDTEKSADIDNFCAGGTGPVDIIDLAGIVVIGAVSRRALQNGLARRGKKRIIAREHQAQHGNSSDE